MNLFRSRKPPQVISTLTELREWRKSVRGTVGFVPTMGALHPGHATLMEQMRSQCDHAVLSIFVNPTQFGPNEDFKAYPRTFEHDFNIAAEQGVDVIFYPSADELYPQGYSTYVEETELSIPLCGKYRPGHFRGVTTVVLKLFNLVQPDLAFFGLKDAQQFFVLQKIALDLNLKVTLIGVPTVRESDGLAMSSRNRFLTPQERVTAPAIYQTLNQLKEQILLQLRSQNEKPEHLKLASLIEAATFKLAQAGFIMQYLDCLALPNLTPWNPSDLSTTENVPGSVVIAIAAFLGKARLIDNVIVPLK